MGINLSMNSGVLIECIRKRSRANDMSEKRGPVRATGLPDILSNNGSVLIEKQIVLSN